MAELTALGVSAAGVVADVSDADGVPALHDKVVQALGPIDILVNNAGGSLARSDVIGTSLSDFRSTFDLNLFGGFELNEAGATPHEGAEVGPSHQHRLDMGAGSTAAI